MPIEETHVLAIMRTESRPIKARRIAWILRTETGENVSRQDVNRLLYAMKHRGIVTVDQDYFWTLLGEARYGVNDPDR